jgi:hypothetical protein
MDISKLKTMGCEYMAIMVCQEPHVRKLKQIARLFELCLIVSKTSPERKS